MTNEEYQAKLDEILDQALEAKDNLRGAESASDVIHAKEQYQEAKLAITKLTEEVVLRARIDELDNVQILYESGNDFAGYIEDELLSLKKKRAEQRTTATNILNEKTE